MKPTPGYPGNPLPPVRVESEPTPPRSYSPPPGELHIRGNGWRLSMPWAVLLALGSAVGARYLPTATSTDVKIEDNRAEQRLRDEEQARRWAEVNAALRGIEQRLGRLEDTRQNDRSITDERLRRLEAK